MQRSAAVLQLFPRRPTRPLLATCSRSYGTRRESKPWKQKPNRKSKLTLILTEDVPKLGNSGHVVRVEHGYGRNWLLPQGKAVYATPDNMKLYDAKNLQEGVDSEADIAVFMKDVFAKHKICIPRGDRGEWAIYEHHIAKQLRRFRLHVPLDCIKLEEPLTSYGEHPVRIRVDEVTVIPFTVTVVPKLPEATTGEDDAVETVGGSSGEQPEYHGQML